MSRRTLIVDPSEYDLNRVVAGIEEIRKYNAQRFEMEQLTAIVYENHEQRSCVGYKDLTEDEFWIRGHMPGLPLMPGVLMCESAAQLTSYYASRYMAVDDGVIGFAGLEEVRFRGMVRPGDRFVIQAKLMRAKSRFLTASFQGLVDDNLVCEGIVKGILLPTRALKD